ncbi:MAG: adenylyltransferase/cytidyltransferase family protein [Patescibacteria group bacterium]|jgi:nicotinamide-nucleotide adenylyltransferase
MQTCIFPGRFQPFHNGHLMVVQGMMKMCENAIIVICESADKKSAEDPFSLDERREMISAALLSADIMDATIVSVKDTQSDEAWAHHVLDSAGNPDEPLVWSGDENVRKIFEAKKVATKKIVPVPGIVGSDIRKMIEKKDRAWRSKVPAGAMDVIENIVEKS